MKWNLMTGLALILIFGFGQYSFAALVLDEFWESDKITGYSASQHHYLNFGEFTAYTDTSQSSRISQTDTTSGSTGGSHGGMTSGSSQTGTTEEHTAFAGLRAVYWEERNDKPCSLTVSPTAIADSNFQTIAKSDNVCPGRISGNSKKVDLSDNEFAIGVSVCTTNKKDTAKNRIKGIRLYSATLGANGTVTPTGGYQGNRHTHCKIWHKPAVMCPADYIVTSLKLYYSEHSYTGIGIKCRKVTTADSPFKE